MIMVSDLRVILNKVHSLEGKLVPEGLELEVKGESPSIYTPDGRPYKRVQGLTVKLSGDKKKIDEFLKQFESTGVYYEWI